MLDVRLSLCGSFFSGTYTDIKSGKSGDVEGCRLSVQASSMSTVREALSKSCLLCTMVCGKLSSSLVSQCPPFPFDLDKEKERVTEADDPAVKRSDVDEVAEEEEEDKAAASAAPTGDTSEKGHLTILKWLRSDLFSGGLPMDSPLTRYLDDEIKMFISPQRAAAYDGYLPAPSTPSGLCGPEGSHLFLHFMIFSIFFQLMSTQMLMLMSLSMLMLMLMSLLM